MISRRQLFACLPLFAAPAQQPFSITFVGNEIRIVTTHGKAVVVPFDRTITVTRRHDGRIAWYNTLEDR